jgi:hypothetical protein
MTGMKDEVTKRDPFSISAPCSRGAFSGRWGDCERLNPIY